jgi:hypothetical protein
MSISTTAATTARSSRLRASVAFEANKLSNNKAGWNLAGSQGTLQRRTRHGGSGRPQLVKREYSEAQESSEEEEEKKEEEEAAEEPEDEQDDEEEEAEEFEELLDELVEGNEDELEDSDSEEAKPSHSQVIVEVKSLMETLKLCRCPRCDHSLDPELKSLCIATYYKLACTNPVCTYVHHSDPPATTSIGDDQDDIHERISDYGFNVLYVLGLTSCGDGGTEAARLLAMLGLCPMLQL